ncbi:hypothetical protein COCMIDRAFT_85847 [Bipolaris oryzae ATCC 44560]|uniref:DUF7779 domain-containing protein n=1 Tax=Bipolaris oryzae ATCC 44560 TaxID=930090 RepID=W6ZZ03_COCMI|nr:uncharacterized protein COCMIDRAFT_85847 [Bipolaris oryzae ATCC 44560]EUC48961.1 hypothetical protein COCMIDRAFT_85847 [Bipolaris oryzae ATCC 44560]
MNFNFGPGRADNGLLASHCQPRPFSMVPFAPDPDYVDRPDIFSWLRDKCVGNGARAALVGLGGVRRVSMQYAHLIRDASPQTFVFWVHASTRARFEEAYKDIADQLQLPGRNDPKENVLQLVRNWLREEANGQWFMVLDNVDDVETFFPSRKRKRYETDTDSHASLTTYLPQSRNGAILVTSRNKDAASSLVGGHNRIHEVLALSIGEGLQLLRNKLCNLPLEESAIKLLQALGCIPLAIIKASAYMNRRANMTVTRYLDDFQTNDKKRESLLKWDTIELRRDESASSSILTTWQMSFDQIRCERPSAADLLSLMSFFSPRGIPERILRRFRNYRVKTTSAEVDDDDDEHDHDNGGFGEDLATLQTYSLVSTTADNTCEMHALVKLCTQSWLSSYGDTGRWEREFIELTVNVLPDHKYGNWEEWQQLAPHVEPLIDSKPATRETSLLWALVLKSLVSYLCDKGSFTAAAQIATKILATQEKILGPSDTATLCTMSQLALVFQHQNRHEEEVKLKKQVLEANTKAWGEYHPMTLKSMKYLASGLCCQRKYDEAENLYQKTLEGCKKELGEKHHSTLSITRDLASFMCLRNRYSEAEKLFQEVLERGKKELGESDDLMLCIMDDMSKMLYYQGRYRESEKLYRQAVDISTKELGEHHPDTLMRTCHLACSLHGLYRCAEATKLYQRAYNELAEKYGSQHLYTTLCHRRFEIMQTMRKKMLNDMNKGLLKMEIVYLKKKRARLLREAYDPSTEDFLQIREVALEIHVLRYHVF